MALGTFIAGRYSATWNAIPLGIAKEGYDITFDPKQQMVNRSDAYGDTLIEMIYRGGDWSVQTDQLEYKPGTIGPAFPFGSSLGALGIIGRLSSDIAQALIFTSTAGTPAAASPATVTASKAILAANANVKLILNSALREVPIRWSLLPYDSSGTIRHLSVV